MSSKIIKGRFFSEEGKNKYGIIVGLLAAVFIITQIAITFSAFLIMPPLMTGGMFDFSEFLKDRIVYSDNVVWLVKNERKFPNSSTGKEKNNEVKKLVKVDIIENRLEEITSLDFEDPWLLEIEGQLWIISPEKVGILKNKNIEEIYSKERLANISYVFNYNGYPAIVEESLNKTSFKVFKNNNWNEKTELKSDFNLDKLKIISFKNDLYFFMFKDEDLCYCKNPNYADFDGSDWKVLITDTTFYSYPVIYNNKLCVFIIVYETHSEDRLILYRIYENKEEKSFEISWDGNALSKGLCTDKSSNKFFILTKTEPERMELFEFQGKKEIRRISIKKGPFSFMGKYFIIILSPQVIAMILPLILAFILTGLMRKYKSKDFVVGEKKVELASLSFRAIAQLIDGIILLFPVVFGYLIMFSPLFGGKLKSGTSPILMMLGFFFILFGFLWIFIGFVLFSYMEGSKGKTPGKKLLKIKVIGTDLKELGFGRAILRNILKIVDGFFNFMVGIIVIALNENCQRLGDMASRSIVIKDE